MKKEEILALGIEEELAQKIADASAEELKGFIPKARFDEVNEAKKNAESLIKERDKQLEDLKSTAGNSEALKKQIDELQEANKTAAKEYEIQLQQIKLDNAVEKSISDAKGKNSIAIKALLTEFLKDAKLDDDGTVKGLGEKLDELSKADDSSFLFGSTVPEVKGFVPKDGQPAGEVDFTKMSYTELSDYLAANPDAKIS